MRYLLWLYWNLHYALRGYPKTFQSFMLAMSRLRHPYWTFEPFIYYNEAGKQWEIWFEEEHCIAEGYNEPLSKLRGHYYRGDKSDRIVGIIIYEESRKPKEESGASLAI